MQQRRLRRRLSLLQGIFLRRECVARTLVRPFVRPRPGHHLHCAGALRKSTSASCRHAPSLSNGLLQHDTNAMQSRSGGTRGWRKGAGLWPRQTYIGAPDTGAGHSHRVCNGMRANNAENCQRRDAAASLHDRRVASSHHIKITHHLPAGDSAPAVATAQFRNCSALAVCIGFGDRVGSKPPNASPTGSLDGRSSKSNSVSVSLFSMVAANGKG